MNSTNRIITTCLEQVDLLLDDMHDGADHEELIEEILDALTEHFEIDYAHEAINLRRIALADELTSPNYGG